MCQNRRVYRKLLLVVLTERGREKAAGYRMQGFRKEVKLGEVAWMSTQRVLKKVSTPIQQLEPTGAILVVNSVDPQINTMRVFLEAINDGRLRYLAIANKVTCQEGTQAQTQRLGEKVSWRHKGMGRGRSGISQLQQRSPGG